MAEVKTWLVTVTFHATITTEVCAEDMIRAQSQATQNIEGLFKREIASDISFKCTIAEEIVDDEVSEDDAPSHVEVPKGWERIEGDANPHMGADE
jgi:hypothetical protein